MATTRRRFYNVKTCTHGSVAVSTVQTITYNRSWTRLNGQGDDDITDTFQAKVNLQVSGTLVLQDDLQADALLDAASDTLAWNGMPEAGGTEKHVEIDGVEFFSENSTNAHNALDGITLNWSAYSPTGVDPVTVALAA